MLMWSELPMGGKVAHDFRMEGSEMYTWSMREDVEGDTLVGSVTLVKMEGRHSGQSVQS